MSPVQLTRQSLASFAACAASLILLIAVPAMAGNLEPSLEAAMKPANIAPEPPLEWDSFDSFGVYVHEKAAMENLEAMAEHLNPYGCEYFVIDNGWFGEYKLKPGTLYPLEKHASDVWLNKYGQVIASKVYFSGGLKPIVDRCHHKLTSSSAIEIDINPDGVLLLHYE